MRLATVSTQALCLVLGIQEESKYEQHTNSIHFFGEIFVVIFLLLFRQILIKSFFSSELHLMIVETLMKAQNDLVRDLLMLIAYGLTPNGGTRVRFGSGTPSLCSGGGIG